MTDPSTLGLGWPRLSRRQGLVLLVVLLLGLALFVWRVGSIGLVDETPPLFAASARAMARTGDWLTPRVNGLPRYDKPPLVYWLMGLGYALPGQGLWNPLGSWAANLPSALSSVAMMLLLTATLLRWLGGPLPPNVFFQTGGLAEALREASLAIASTGTVTMECALFRVPTIALYKTSWSTYQIAKRIITVKYLAMPNLLAREEIFPEFVQDAATGKNLANTALALLRSPEQRQRIQEKLDRVIESLGSSGANIRAAQVIWELL